MKGEIILRRAVPQDLEAVVFLESQATPNLRYLHRVFEMFLNDREGEFSVAEHDGRIVGCGKFTVQPDGSAWLEALRVLPDHQGQGIGKRFYQRFFDNARTRGVSILRMYTNIGNATSRGLAERYGFRWVATYRGSHKMLKDDPAAGCASSFRIVDDPCRAVELLMPHRDLWTGFVVMNRTFYSLTADICAAWATEGKVYEDPRTSSVIALGARFMPEQALHIALAHGDSERWLGFACSRARGLGVDRIQCMYPPSHEAMEVFLLANGFELDAYDCIVMQARQDATHSGDDNVDLRTG